MKKCFIIFIFVLFMITGCSQKITIENRKKEDLEESTIFVESIQVSDSFKIDYGYSDAPVLDAEGNKIADGSIEWKYDKSKDNVIIIKCQANPSDAANTTLKYVLDLDEGYDEANPTEDVTGKAFSYAVQNDGTLKVTLLKGKDVTVTIKSSDRDPGASLVIQIKVKISGGGIVPPKPGK